MLFVALAISAVVAILLYSGKFRHDSKLEFCFLDPLSLRTSFHH